MNPVFTHYRALISQVELQYFGVETLYQYFYKDRNTRESCHELIDSRNQKGILSKLRNTLILYAVICLSLKWNVNWEVWNILNSIKREMHLSTFICWLLSLLQSHSWATAVLEHTLWMVFAFFFTWLKNVTCLYFVSLI